jgi:uncharacterized protein (DUF305 family)
MKRPPSRLSLAIAAGVCLVTGGNAIAQSDSFARLMDQAMGRMDHDMMRSMNGDPDHDFASMMIPHHQGAIDMAEAELRFGKDERLRRLAQGIIVEQNQEIAVMRQILSEGPAASGPPQGHTAP